MLKAALFYFALTFAVGFCLGVLRTLLVAPRVGEVNAVLIEAPFILSASFLTARWVLGRLHPPACAWRRLAIGLLAFAMLMFAELLMSWILGNSTRDFVDSLLKPAGLIGLAGQVIFALIPLFITRRPLKLI
jgi:hypothetical protein